MNSGDFFKKLVTGVRFDFNKYRSDAVKFKMVRKEPPVKEKEEEDTGDKNEEEVNISKDGRKGKKRKTRNSQEEQEEEQEATKRMRKEKRIVVYGEDVPRPVESFEELLSKYGVSEKLLENMRETQYMTPTPVQCQAIPLMLERRELLTCAPTGSGKTLAFLVPILHQLKGPMRSGFRAIIVTPTRELAKQIHKECLWISMGTELRVHLIKNTDSAVEKFGPESKLKYDILVTTPKRLVHLLKMKPPAICLKNLEWLVVDECDKLFELGFREQLSVIYKACSESTKVRRAMFSATFDSNLEKWFQMNLDNVVTLIVGGKNRATELIDQQLIFVGTEEGKLIALRDLIGKGLEAPVLIFVDNIERAKKLFNDFIYDGINVDVIHSDRTQQQRDSVVRAFREGKVWFLICTELMGRGIDFKGVNILINYDFPQNKVSYIHRIGRTGRAGNPGKAITFFMEKDAGKLKSIVSVMRQSGCDVPDYLLNIKHFRRGAGFSVKPKKKKPSSQDTNASEDKPEKKSKTKKPKKKAKAKKRTKILDQQESE